MPRILHSRAIVWLRLTVATGVVFSLLVAVGLLGLYYKWFGRLFGPRVGRVTNSRTLRHLAPLWPLYALTLPVWLAITPSAPRMVSLAVWFLLGVLTVEAYCAGLYVRSMQTSAAAVPRPIIWRASWRGRRHSDIRLHRLLEVHLIYAIAPIIATAAVSWREPTAAILAILYPLRYLAYALDMYDFEAVVHWHMHTRSLLVRDRPSASAFVNFAMNYIVGPLNGYVPRLYEIEHMRLHHRYDSGPGDPYSPMPFRRTSLVEFSWFAMFVTLADMTGLALVTERRLSWRWRRLAFLNAVGYWLIVGVLLASDRPLGILLPLFAMLHGLDQAKSQYKWHGLPDADNPEDPLGNTILWVASETAWREMSDRQVVPSASNADDTSGRDWTYFDNYHLIHHLYPSAHFDRYVDLLRQRAPEIVAAGGIVMTLPTIASSAFKMWSGDIEGLEKALITEPAEGLDKRELIRRRLEPVPQVRHADGRVFDSPPVRRLDQHLVRWLGLITGGR